MYDRAAVTAVVDYAKSKGFLPDFLLSLVAGESSLNLNAYNPAGWAGGLQINVNAWGGPPEKWMGVDGLARSFAVMEERWVKVLMQVPDAGGWWQRDPVAMLTTTWPAMQGADPAGCAREAPRAAREGAQAWAEYQAYGPPPPPPPSTVPKPPITFIAADPRNYDQGRPAGIQHEALVLHTTAGSSTIEQLGAWFAGGNIAQGLIASTHFGVDVLGHIGQFVTLDDTAYAHGIVRNPTARLVRENDGLNPNGWAIGIEHLDRGIPGAVTPEQLEASARLAAWLWATEIQPYAGRTGAKLDRDHIIQHSEIDSVGKPFCASWPEDRIAAYITRVGQILNAGPVAPPVPPPPPPEPPPPGPRTDDDLLRELAARFAACKARGDAAEASAHEWQRAVEAQAAFTRSLQDALTVEAAVKREMALVLDDQSARLRIQAGNSERVVREG